MMESGHNPFDQKYFYRDTLSDGELDQDDEFINNYHMGTWSLFFSFTVVCSSVLRVKDQSRLMGVVK